MSLKSLSLIIILALMPRAYADANYGDSEMFPQNQDAPAPAAAAPSGPPSGLLDTCTDAIDKYKKAMATPATTDNKSCLDQINKSWKACYNDNDNPDATQALYSTPGNGDQRLMAGYTTGKENALKYSEACRTEKANVDQVCGKAVTDNANKLSGNSQALNGVDETLNSTTDANQRQEFLNQKSTLHDDSIKLQDEKTQLTTLRDNGSKAMAERQTCHANQASLYDSAINKTSAHLSSISAIDGQNPTPDINSADVKDGSNPDVDGAVKDATVKGSLKTAGSVAGFEASEGAGMGAKAAFTIMSGDLGGAATDLIADGTGTSVAANAAKGAVVGEVAGPLGMVAGATASVALSPTPTSACDTINIDPLRAYKAGCSVNTTQAINVLQSP